jgi:hypothetical protein
MVALAIEGLLTEMALPAFQLYPDTIRFSEAIVAINTMKIQCQLPNYSSEICKRALATDPALTFALDGHAHN